MTRPFWLPSRLFLPPLIFILVYLAHFLRLNGIEFPSGWDAYFYLIQVKALVEEGQMHSPDSSPVYLLLKWIYAICGDYELAFQHLCAGLGAFFSTLLFALSFRLTRNTLLALCIGSWCLASPTLAFFAANFPKNLLGIDFLLLLFLFSIGKTRFASVIAFFLTAISHRMTAGLGFLFIGFRYLSLRTLLLVTVGIALLLLASLAIPGLLNLSDLQRFDNALSSIPQIPHLSFVNLLDLTQTQPIWVVEIAIAAGLWIWTLLNLIFRPIIYGNQLKYYRGIFFLSLILFFPFLTIDVTSMGYRFFLTGMLIIPIFMIPLLHYSGWVSRTLGLFALISLAVWGLNSINTAQYDPDYGKYSRIAEKVTANFGSEPPELIIAHKGLAEVITFKTGIDVLPWQPEYEIDPLQLYRIASEISDFEIEAVLGRPLGKGSKQLGISYLLLPEHDWQEFVSEVESENRDEELLERIHQWQNPMETRPAYLLRNKSAQ